MTRRQWLMAVPVVGLAGGGWLAFRPSARGRADQQYVTEQLRQMQQKLGRHLYCPTWLPANARPGPNGVVQGRHRVLQEFSIPGDRSVVILAQEPRSEERDRYHQRLFVRVADARADLNGRTGYFITGTSGERRLFWNTDDSALILSSTWLDDEQMTRVARSIR